MPSPSRESSEYLSPRPKGNSVVCQIYPVYLGCLVCLMNPRSQKNKTRSDRPEIKCWWWISANDGGYQQELRVSRSKILQFGGKSEPFLQGIGGTHIAPDWDLSLIHISEPTRQAEISYAV